MAGATIVATNVMIGALLAGEAGSGTVALSASFLSDPAK